jgi:hypothetical protein
MAAIAAATASAEGPGDEGGQGFERLESFESLQSAESGAPPLASEMAGGFDDFDEYGEAAPQVKADPGLGEGDSEDEDVGGAVATGMESVDAHDDGLGALDDFDAGDLSDGFLSD